MSTSMLKRTTEEGKTKVIQMWNDGYTSGEIAKVLMFTRSQVMGIVHRARKAGLAESHVVVVQKKEVAPQVVRPPSTVFRFGKETSKKKRPPTKAKPDPVIPKKPDYKGPRNILNIKDGDCRWVVSPGMFCARPVGKEHRSWCTDHYKVVYIKSEKRDKKLHAEVLMHKMKFNF